MFIDDMTDFPKHLISVSGLAASVMAERASLRRRVCCQKRRTSKSPRGEWRFQFYDFKAFDWMLMD